LCISANHPASSFNSAIWNLVQPSSSTLSDDNLAEVCRVLKPKGSLYLGTLVLGSLTDESRVAARNKTSSAFKLSGFVNVSEVNSILKVKNIGVYLYDPL